ncbi:hypothetical protein HOD29_00980 [archaeon]|jgi:hypothetical protein|nr:hypothetical protein [archaeon]
MIKLEYNVGDVIDYDLDTVAYLQHEMAPGKFGIFVYSKGTSWNRLGYMNFYLERDSVIDDVTKYKKLSEKEYHKRFRFKEFKEKLKHPVHRHAKSESVMEDHFETYNS